MNTFLTVITSFLDKYAKAIGMVGMIGILVVGWFLVLSPQMDSLREGGIFPLQTQQAVLEQRTNDLTRLQGVQRQMSVLPAGYESTLNEVVPTTFETPSLFFELQKIAQTSGVRLVSASTASSSLNDAPLQAGATSRSGMQAVSTEAKKIPVTFTVAGLTYDRLVTLLKNLEESVHIYNIATITYTPTTELYTFNAITYSAP